MSFTEPMYVCRFAQHWEDFRVPELEAVAKIQNIKLSYDQETNYKRESPYMKMHISNSSLANLAACPVQKILDRAILIKDFMELWVEAESLEALHTELKQKMELFQPYMEASFKFLTKTFGKTLNAAEKLELINSFAYSNLNGPIKMADPEITFALFIDYDSSKSPITSGHFYFGIYVGRSARGRHLDALDLKRREYLGTTSMDAELSLIMTNMGLVQQGSLVYDPFAGTGSFLYTASYFGAFTLGSDIDGRQMRGKPATSTAHRGPKYKKTEAIEEGSLELPSIYTNVRQYGLQGRVLDCLVFDVSHNPWRQELQFSAIVCDPPYGVRAGAKKLGASPTGTPKVIPAELKPLLYPSTQPYDLAEMTNDLMDFAFAHLLPGGRLVFWYPVEVDDVHNFKIEKVATHQNLTFVAASLHHCKGFDRWLITMEK